MLSALLAALVLGVLVLLLDPAWTRGITCAVPDAAGTGNACWGADARLILYVLTWVARTLVRNPAQLFDPPIGFPAPAALTGSEDLLASQLLFGPLYAFIRNPVLAANVTALASYWLGGLAMFGLLRAWDVSWMAALLGAVIGMLGPFQLPPDLHVLQYPSWCLPLVMLVATWTRNVPSGRRIALLSMAITLAIFASYQIALNLALLAAILVGDELFIARAGWRRGAGVAGTFLAPFALLALASMPYLRRLTEARYHAALDLPGAAEFTGFAFQLWWREMRWSVLALAALAVVRRRMASPRQREAIAFGLVAALAGSVLALGWSVRVAGWTIPLPFGLLSLALPSAVLAPTRFAITAGIGAAILAACGIDTLLRPPRPGPVKVLALALVPLVVLDARSLPANAPPTCLPTSATSMPPAYQWLRDSQDGTLLELPAGRLECLTQATAMYLSLFHHRPVINIHTHHAPPVTPMILDAAARLPDPDALQALVDMTRVRWILVHEDALPVPLVTEVRERWRASQDVSPAAIFGHDVVYAVERVPRNDWFIHVSRPREAGRTLLGTPLHPLLQPAATIVATAAPTARAGGAVSLHLAVRNDGGEVWPVAVPEGTREPFVVAVEMRWEGATPPATRIELPYDVSPGATVQVDTLVAAPVSPGRYVMRWTLTQDGGAPFPAASTAERSIIVAPP